MNYRLIFCTLLLIVFSTTIKSQGDSIRVAFKALETLERLSGGDTTSVCYLNETTYKQNINYFLHCRNCINKYPQEEDMGPPTLVSKDFIDINEVNNHFNKWLRDKHMLDTDSTLIKGDSIAFAIRPSIRQFKTTIIGSKKGRFNCELLVRINAYAYPDDKFFSDSVNIILPWVNFPKKDSITWTENMTQIVNTELKNKVRSILFSEKFQTALKAEVDSTCHPPIPELIRLKIANLDPSTDVSAKVKGVVTIKTSTGHGSGCIVSQDGYILTNYHVIEDDSVFSVFNESIESISAKVIRVNKKKDLALLKIDKNDLYPLKLKTSIAVVGAEVYTIGTAANVELGQTVSKGIVSAVRVLNKTRYIQTDAKINMGSTGGAMLDNTGNLIGVVNAKLVGKNVEGISFAIPASVVIRFLNINY